MLCLLFYPGPPLQISVITRIDLCVGVIFNVPAVEPDTDLNCKLLRDSDHELLYEGICNKTSIFTHEMLKYRPGIYVFEIVPSNLAGYGEPTSRTFSINSSCK